MTARPLALAAALLFAAGAANAAVMNFDNPDPIVIDNATGQATYTESGFTISGNAADFLTIDFGLVGGFDGAEQIRLRQQGGGQFQFVSLDYSFYDLTFSGAPPGNLILIGLQDGLPVAAQMLALGTSPATFSAGAAWAKVDAVAINGTSGFLLDNVVAVPEPASWALLGAGLALIAARRARRSAAD